MKTTGFCKRKTWCNFYDVAFIRSFNSMRRLPLDQYSFLTIPRTMLKPQETSSQSKASLHIKCTQNAVTLLNNKTCSSTTVKIAVFK